MIAAIFMVLSLTLYWCVRCTAALYCRVSETFNMCLAACMPQVRRAALLRQLPGHLDGPDARRGGLGPPLPAALPACPAAELAHSLTPAVLIVAGVVMSGHGVA
jgi:hypothetical protein